MMHKRWICCLVAVALIGPAVPIRALAAGNGPLDTSAPDAAAPATVVRIDVREALNKAALDLAARDLQVRPDDRRRPNVARASRPAARTASAPAPRQGGGSSTMILALIGTVAGLAATYYVIKQSEDQDVYAEAR